MKKCDDPKDIYVLFWLAPFLGHQIIRSDSELMGERIRP